MSWDAGHAFSSPQGPQEVLMDFQNSEPGIDGCAALRDRAAEGLVAAVEPGLPRGVSEALADPIVQALMTADRIDSKCVEELMQRIAARLRAEQ
jgi:hypothetical protein